MKNLYSFLAICCLIGQGLQAVETAAPTAQTSAHKINTSLSGSTGGTRVTPVNLAQGGVVLADQAIIDACRDKPMSPSCMPESGLSL